MNIAINIYADCTSDKPTKTYTIKRLLFKTAKELSAIQAEAKNAGDEEQPAFTLKMLKTLVPDFQDEDFDGVDPLELGSVFRTIGAAISGIVANAEKN